MLKNILCAKTGACQAAQRPTDLTEIQPPHASVQKNVKEKIFKKNDRIINVSFSVCLFLSVYNHKCKN